MDMLKLFMDQPVTVDTPIGSVAGVLKHADKSKHGGIGCLLLSNRHSWIMVKNWFSIKRKAQE